MFPAGTPDGLGGLTVACLFEGEEETPLMNFEGFCACCFEEEEVRLAPGMVEKWEFFSRNPNMMTCTINLISTAIYENV